MSEKISTAISDQQFEERVLKNKGVVLVDFWAPWCGPCIQMGPGLDNFARDNEGKVKVYKLDVDENPKTAEKYEIRSVPTVIFFRGGEPLFVSRAAMSQASMQKKLDELLGSPS